MLFSESKISLQSQIVHLCYTVLPSIHVSQKKHLTPFLLLLELVLLLAVLFVIVGDVGVGRLVVMSIVRRRWFPGAVQPGEFGGADFLRARGAGHAPGVLGPALLCGAATGGQEALGHGCFGLITPLIHTSPLHHTCSGQKYKILTQTSVSTHCSKIFSTKTSVIVHLFSHIIRLEHLVHLLML